MLAIHLDLVGGISGDMFVAAIVDALPLLATPILAELAAVQAAGEADPVFRETATGGLRANSFGTAGAADQAVSRGAPGGTASASLAKTAGMHSGTAYPALRRRLTDAPLAASTRTHALALLVLLAEAEARVHGTSVDDVHFHELADWDSLMDVVAAGCIAARLEGTHWSASAAPLGGGTVRTTHGLLPVPAPATSLLLTGYPWVDDGIAGERVTPTGAAILRHLVPAAHCGTGRVAGRLHSIGCGAGTRTLPGLPNIVRALVMDRGAAPAGETDVVAVVEFDVDDMTGEEIAVAADQLRAEPGVIDVSVGVRQGKKGRPLADFRLLAKAHAADAVARACFTETSTLGLRVRDESRRVLRRVEVAGAVDGAQVDVKLAERPGAARTAKAAHDHVASTRGLDARRRVLAAAAQRALGDAEE
jgi:uncharacterized protein (TIGR00299 family) protein